MKTHGWKNPNKADITTGHKGFDAALTAPMTGNAITGTQNSAFIRPRNQVEHDGRPFPPGHLRDFDLQAFQVMPEQVRRAVLAATEDRSAILYQFFHPSSEGLVTHGYLLTRTGADFYELIGAFETGPTRKSSDVLRTMADYVSNPDGTSVRFRTEVLPETVEVLVGTVEAMGPDVAEGVGRVAALVAEGTAPNRGDSWRILSAIAEGRKPSASAASQTGMAAFRSAGEALSGMGEDVADGVRQAIRVVLTEADVLKREFGLDAVIFAAEGFARAAARLAPPEPGLRP